LSRERGLLVVLAGPSGAGKTTLSHHLVDRFPRALFSVSVTTRSPRGDERSGVDYLFVSEEEFRSKLEEDFFLEHAEVHGHLYGTSRKWVTDKLDEGRSVVLDIDVQGALQVRESFPSSVLIFVLPPDPEMLQRRLKERNTDDPETVRRRMAAAAWETSWIGHFDYFVSNDDLSVSKRAVESIFQSESSRIDRIPFPEEAARLLAEELRGLAGWRGRRVIVASGPTREPIDAVRFISNRSSGLMGRCLAQAFRDAGATVVCVTGPACVAPPSGTEVVHVENAMEMLEALRKRIMAADLLVMAAAVADFRPASRTEGKISRSGHLSLEMEATPDILETLKEEYPGHCPVLAFALEMGPGGRERAVTKLRRKGADAIFLNPGNIRGSGMESPTNRGELIFADGSSARVPPASKRYIAQLLAAAMGRYLLD